MIEAFSQPNDENVGHLAGEPSDRVIIDQLIADTRLYDSPKAVKELLDFTTRFDTSRRSMRCFCTFKSPALATPHGRKTGGTALSDGQSSMRARLSC
jgi:hypothetical protein